MHCSQFHLNLNCFVKSTISVYYINKGYQKLKPESSLNYNKNENTFYCYEINELKELWI